MKFTLSWLKKHLDLSPEETKIDAIADKLNQIGLEIESIDRRQNLAPFVIAKILSAKPHENADKLQVLAVDIGQEIPLQIVCGAPNARKSMVGVLARPGDYIPGLEISLSLSQIRGVESQGMMCSGAELLLSNESDGIIELPEDAPIGRPFAEYCGLDDPIFDISITPNRGDCTHIYGIARDLAAAKFGHLKPLPSISFSSEGNKKIEFILDKSAEDFCQAFLTRSILQVKNGPSPQWLQQALCAIGLRPINRLVDIGNYLTFDLGCPMHIFDADKIKGNAHIRTANEGEIFEALNDKSYILKAGQGLICDEDKILSLCGIMGSAKSECDEHTTNIIIETALWDPYQIAQTGRILGLNSDARYRFERGVDPNMIGYSLDMATKMILELAGGNIQKTHIVKAPHAEKKIIKFPLEEIKRLTSLDLPKVQIIEFLNALGCEIKDANDHLFVTPPSWRYDLFEKADLVEEIMRLYGIDNIKAQPLPKTNIVHNILTPLQKLKHYSARILAARGLLQTINWSFIDHNEALHFGGGQKALQLENPIAKTMSDMRPNLIAGLLNAVARNQARAFHDLAFFEIGHSYKNQDIDGQKLEVAGLRTGFSKYNNLGRFWQDRTEMVSVFDVKEDSFALLEFCGIKPQQCSIDSKGAPSWYHPGRSGAIKMGPKIVLGYFGELHPNTLEFFKITHKVCAFELFLENFPKAKQRTNKSKKALFLSNFQPVYRDFSFILDKKIEAINVSKAALAADKKHISDIKIFDVFYDDNLGQDKKSIAIEATIQPLNDTLTDEQIDTISTKIIENIIKNTGAILRDKK